MKSDDPDVEELSRQIDELRKTKNPWATGTEHEFEITTTPGTVRIQHKLGREPQGWIVTRMIFANAVSLTEQPLLTNERSITFWAEHPCRGKVLVY